MSFDQNNSTKQFTGPDIPENKMTERQMLEKEVQDFIDSGGQIAVIPTGDSRFLKRGEMPDDFFHAGIRTVETGYDFITGMRNKQQRRKMREMKAAEEARKLLDS